MEVIFKEKKIHQKTFFAPPLPPIFFARSNYIEKWLLDLVINSDRVEVKLFLSLMKTKGKKKKRIRRD